MCDLTIYSDVDLMKGEQLKESFVKVVKYCNESNAMYILSIYFFQLNPEHTLPTLIDNDFVIWDSHTICAYLVDKYGINDQLYPKDLQLRAKCNQRLFFNAGSLFPCLRDCTVPILFKGCSYVSQDKIDAINAKYDILETLLACDQFLVGNNLTIADICVAGTVLPLEVYVPIQADKYPKILAWIERINRTIPIFKEMHAKYLIELKELIETTIRKNQQKS